MAATTFSFRQGDSYTIGIRLDANYDILGLQEIKLSMFGDIFIPEPTADPRVFRFQISSDRSAFLVSARPYPLQLFLDDSSFGVKSFTLAIAYVNPSSTPSNDSINTGYDIILDIGISSVPVEVLASVLTLVKGEQGEQGERGERGIEGSVTDGDKGDVVVSNFGASWVVKPSLKSQSTTQSYLAGAALSALKLIKLNNLDQLVYADSSSDATVLGLTFQAVSGGVAPTVVLSGLVTDPSWNWARGAPLYLGSSGDITTIVPVSGYIVPIGNAEAPTTINLKISQGVQIN